MIDIGLKIKELMSQNKIDAPELAKRIGKTKQAVYAMLDKEDVNTSVLKELSDIFHVPLVYFLTESENSVSSQEEVTALKHEIVLTGEEEVLGKELNCVTNKPVGHVINKTTVELVAEREHLTLSDFARKISAKPQNMYDIRSGKVRSLSPTLADKILAVFPKYSRSWLITGEGEMLNEKPNYSSYNRKGRFAEAYNILRSRGMAHKQKDVAIAMGATPPNVSAAFKGDVKVLTDSFLQRFNKAFGGIFNDDWLLTGEGEMLNGKSNNATSKSTNHVILYYPNVDGTMGGMSFLDNPDETVCEITIPGCSDCKFAINAYGDSMTPLIKSGQIVLLSEWTERFIDWGSIYLIVTKTGYRVIKRLYPGSTDSAISCISENKEANPPFEIEKDDIHKIYLVKGWICRDAL